MIIISIVEDGSQRIWRHRCQISLWQSANTMDTVWLESISAECHESANLLGVVSGCQFRSELNGGLLSLVKGRTYGRGDLGEWSTDWWLSSSSDDHWAYKISPSPYRIFCPGWDHTLTQDSKVWQRDSNGYSIARRGSWSFRVRKQCGPNQQRAVFVASKHDRREYVAKERKISVNIWQARRSMWIQYYVSTCTWQ